jgi:hypothetical protein
MTPPLIPRFGVSIKPRAVQIVIGIALRERKVIDCGCFGPTAPKKITWVSLLRNALLLAIAVFLIIVPSQAFSVAPMILASGSAPSHLTQSAGVPLLIAATTGTLGALLVSDALRARKTVRAFIDSGNNPK